MKSFLKYTLATIVGIFLSFVVLFGLLGAIAGIASSFADKEVTVKENSILKLKFNKPIVDHTTENPFENFDFGSFQVKTSLGLDDILKNLEKAAADDDIKGIYLELSFIQSGYANLKEVRDALLDFKESGKFIIAYAENYNQATYYLASVADELYQFPEGDFELRGLYTELAFFKGALEKLGVDAQIFRGPGNKYKSAVEPFMYDKMSESSREQVSRFLDVFWSEWREQVASGRSLSPDSLHAWADDVKVRFPSDAKELGLLDDLLYASDIEALLKEKTEREEDDELEFISISKYNKVKDPNKPKSWKVKEKIAVIYAEGGIVSGSGEQGEIGSASLTKQIKDAAEDSTIKAIVLRVNSPGGSALASEVIWKATQEAKKEKPFIVSMGNLAASGGYYISCGADKIYADPNTITGSIGVFAMIPNLQEMMNDKLGVTFDGVKTNRKADLITVSKPIDDEGRAIIEEGIAHIYDLFIQRVSDGRGIEIEMVDSIARGRVWAGSDALENRLVDELGGLNAAIAFAQEQAGLEEYRIKAYPEKKDPFQQIIEELEGQAKMRIVQEVLGQDYDIYRQLNAIRDMKGYQARLPYEIKVW